MKRRALLCGAFAGALLSPALSSAAYRPRVLVVWYSKSGNTAAIGEMIAERTGADTFEIVPERFYGRERPKISQDAKREREERDFPAIKGQLPDLSKYDLVFVGSPAWWYGLATPVMAFLDRVDFHGARVAGFNTCAGDGHLFEEELRAQARNAKFAGPSPSGAPTTRGAAPSRPTAAPTSGITPRRRAGGSTSGSPESWPDKEGKVRFTGQNRAVNCPVPPLTHGGPRKYAQFQAIFLYGAPIMNFRILPLVLLSAVSFAGGAGSAQAAEPIRLRVTAAGHTLTATLLDNATARAFAARLPLTLHMKDLFAREMCHNLRKGLPAEEAGTSGYEVGDITYWLPMKSFVIMYRQNGEVISSMQKVGRIDKGVEIFARTGDTDVTFELLEP